MARAQAAVSAEKLPHEISTFAPPSSPRLPAFGKGRERLFNAVESSFKAFFFREKNYYIAKCKVLF